MASKRETARATVILNGQQANATLKEIEASARQLNAELRKMPTNSKQFEESTKQYSKIKTRLTGIRSEINGTQTSMSKFAQGVNKYMASFMMIGAAIGGVVMSIKSLLEGSAKLSDAFADIQKTTGRSAKEVRELSSSLSKINTRSAKKDLLELAYVAGKLGYTSKADILGFVKAADQINVALAKDLGGNAEEAIRLLGKLTDTFKVKEKYGIEQALLKTGSAINALGAASTANEAYMVTFTKRIGGIAPQAGLSIENVLGLAATLDQLGQKAEMSSTAMSQLLVKMFSNTSEFAKIAGLDVKEFSTMLSVDANEAMIMFLEGLQKNDGGLKELASKFKGLGIEGSRAIGVIGALSNNIEVLRKSQKLSNDEFKKGTSLTDEFTIKNSNMAGNLEKVEKWMRKLFINSAVMKGLGKMVKMFSDWVKIPVSKVLQDEYTQVNVLVSKLVEANTSLEDRNKLYNELKDLAPDVLKGINSENIAIGRLKDNLRLFNEQMINKIILQKKDEQITKQQDIAADKREQRVEQEMEVRKQLAKVIQTASKDSSIEGQALEEIYWSQVLSLQQKKDQMIAYIEDHAGMDQNLANKLKTGSMIFRNYAEEEQAALDEIQRLLDEKDVLSKQLGVASPTGGSPDPSPGDPGGTGKDFDGGATDAELQAAKQHAAYLKKIHFELMQAKAAAQADELQRELDMVEANLQERLSKITGHTKEEEELRAVLKKASLVKMGEITNKHREKEGDLEFKLQRELLEAKIGSANEYSQEYITLTLELLRLEMEHTLANTHLTEQQRQTIIDTYRKNKGSSIKKFDTKVDLEQANFEQQMDGMRLRSVETLAQRKLEIAREVNEKYRELLAANVDDEQRTAEIKAQMAQETATLQKEAAQDAAAAMAQSMVDFAAGAASAFGSLFSTLDKMENAHLQTFKNGQDKKRDALKKRLNAGLISQKQYDAGIAKMDVELDNKKRKLQHDQAVRAKALALVQAVINVAQAVTTAFTAGPISGIVLAALTAVLGAVQIGLILGTKIPEAARGRYNVIGEESGRKYSNVPSNENPETGFYSSPLLIGETGEEMVIDPATTKNLKMNYPQVIQAIQYARVPQAAAGRYSEPTTTDSPGLMVDPDFALALNRFNDHLDKGIPAYISYDHLQDVNETISEIEISVSND